MKILALRRPDACGTCGSALAVGDRAGWDASARTVHCLVCIEPAIGEAPQAALALAVPAPVRSAPHQPTVPQQRAGASAQREFEKRSNRREQRIRSAHPKLGGLILALSNDPTSTRVWAQGAAGERAVGNTLDELSDEHAVVLHDRSLRRPDGRPSRANIDHLAVAASGVWVIDAKTHHGSLEVRRSGGLFSPRVEKLYIRGRDQTRLVEGVLKQVAAVAAELANVGANVTVRGALCFVGTELPWFGSSSIDNVPLVGRRGLAKILKAPGDLAAEDRDAIGDYLATRFAAAVV